MSYRLIRTIKMLKVIVITCLLLSIQETGYSQQIGDGLAPVISNFGDILLSGGYNGVNPSGGVPDNSHPWQHLFVIRHSNTGNNHQFQFGTSFSENDRLFFRKIAADLQPRSSQWFELATRGSNTFIGLQKISNPGGSSYLQIEKSNSDVEAGISILNAGNPMFYFYSDNITNNLNIQAGGLSGEDDNHPRMSFPYANKNIYMALSGGNVGIGTTNPQNTLDVNGTIRSKEVKVETGWADFVFAPDYNLRPLHEVETYIAQHGALPEIPTAKDVEENGVSLGEMNVKLLQKIEEQTLYIIELNKKMESLMEKDKELERKIEEMTK